MVEPLSDVRDPPAVYAAGAQLPPAASPSTDARHVAVAVIGAGFTGRSVALHLAEAGVDVAVLEAKEVGSGGVGSCVRPGGAVSQDRPSADPLRHYGPERGARVIDAIAAGPDLVFELASRGMGSSAGRCAPGCCSPRTRRPGRRDLESRTAYWQARGAPVEMLEGTACAEAVGSSLYAAASLERRGGNLNLLAYVRGLARATAAAGAAIHTRTPVRGIIRRNGRWEVAAGGANGSARRLTADAVLLATNAYTGDLWPGLRESIVPVRGHGFSRRRCRTMCGTRSCRGGSR